MIVCASEGLLKPVRDNVGVTSGKESQGAAATAARWRVSMAAAVYRGLAVDAAAVAVLSSIDLVGYAESALQSLRKHYAVGQER